MHSRSGGDTYKVRERVQDLCDRKGRKVVEDVE
jgi:hypothetical protein